MNTKEKIQISIPNLISFLKIGLENIDALTENQKKVKVKDIYFVSLTTLVCEYYSEYEKSLDVKQQVATITGFLSGFFKDDLYDGIKVNYFGVKAFTEKGIELLYSISTRGAAKACAKGDSIEWLKNTYFQENTSDFRLSRAKTFISDIENAIRQVINDIYSAKFGDDWWNFAINETISRTIKSTYSNQFGESSDDGSILVKYSFTLDLKKIISSDWGSFKDLFIKKDKFEDTMVRLNVIRREEAHNRDITEEHIKDLEEIYEILLSEISKRYASIELTYMIEHWKSKIKSIFVYENHIETTYTTEQFEESTLEQKRQLIIQDCNSQIDFITSIISGLETIPVPISKKETHEELKEILLKYQNLQNERLNCCLTNQFEEVPQLVTSIKLHREMMDVFLNDFLLSES